MKLIDFDGMFDKKISEYLESNEGKYTEKQWSNIIPKLYDKFGDTVVKSVGKTPREYYGEMSDETLIETLREHIKQDVPVSDFLCLEMEKRGGGDAYLSLLYSDDEELINYGITVNGSSEKALPIYLDIISSKERSEDIKDSAADMVKENADVVAEKLMQMYRSGTEKAFTLDMISRIKARSDEIYEILLNEFLSNLDDIPMYASRLASYGDERALPYLFDQIKREDINYVEFQELKYAIEALGGEYEEPRDFSSDPYFREIHGMSEKEMAEAFDKAMTGMTEEETES